MIPTLPTYSQELVGNQNSLTALHMASEWIRKGHYTIMHIATMNTDAWRALSPKAQALFPWLRLEWKGPKANNNGSLSLSYREAAKAMGIKKAETVGVAFRELQAKGFVKVHQMAVLGVEGLGKSFEYEITDIPMPGQKKPSYLFREWREGHDFSIARASIGNPSGKCGKTKPHPKNRHTPVPINGTK